MACVSNGVPPPDRPFITRTPHSPLGRHSLKDTIFDLLAGVFLFISIQLNYLTLIVTAITILSTAFYTYYHDGRHLVVRLDFSLFSFAIVFPIITMYTTAFRRREQALDALARVKAEALMIHLAHRDWEVPHQSNVPTDHHRNVQRILLSLLDHLVQYLSTPLVYVRDYTFSPSLVQEVSEARVLYIFNVTASLKKLSRETERLKRAGLSGAEAQRLSGFIETLATNIAILQNFKEYRNPQGIRAFSRFFLLVYPLIYGSYYGYVSRETNFAVGVCLALLGSIALCAILNEGIGLEDAFLPSQVYLNDIRIKDEIRSLQEQIALDDLQAETQVSEETVLELERRVTDALLRNTVFQGAARRLHRKSRSIHTHLADLVTLGIRTTYGGGSPTERKELLSMPPTAANFGKSMGSPMPLTRAAGHAEGVTPTPNGARLDTIPSERTDDFVSVAGGTEASTTQDGEIELQPSGHVK